MNFEVQPADYYTWLRRYEQEGADGLRDRSKGPRTSPNATRAEVVDKIIRLRKRGAGPSGTSRSRARHSADSAGVGVS